jgi:hypothetical protein
MARALDPLVQALGTKPGVRTTQSEKDAPLRFGKLGWDEKSARKWTHDSPDTRDRSPGWTFMEGELWCPHWLECRRAGKNPVLFLSFANPFLFAPPRPGQFNQLFHLAMPAAFFRGHLEKVDDAIDAIRRELEASDCVMRRTPWNLNYDSVQSTLNNHMKYRDYTKELRFDVGRTDGKWQPYEAKAVAAE